MIIKELKLHNFGVYAGDNAFTFSGGKPVALIGGLNGRGKTTFLEAILLALYGSNSFAYTESKFRTYAQYLKAYVNMADGTKSTFIELIFELDHELYSVRRAWTGEMRTKEAIYVCKEGQYNKFLTENWSLFIENILPSGISSFFFFDGEKIAELAVESTNAQMKTAIKALLGITVIDSLSHDIRKVISKVEKEKENDIDMKELNELRTKKEKGEQLLAEADAELERIDAELEEAQKYLEKLQHEYSSSGGDIADQNSELLAQKNVLVAQLESVKDELSGIAGGALPLVLTKELLLKIRKQSEKEQESRMLSFAMEKINSTYENYVEIVPDVLGGTRQFVDYFEQYAKSLSTPTVYGLSDHAVYQLRSLIRADLDKAKAEALEAIKKSRQLQLKVNEIESYLSVDIDEKGIQKLYKKLKTQEQKIMELQVKKEIVEKNRGSLNWELIRTNAAYKKCVETVLSRLELSDDGDRIMKYSYNANRILEEFKIRLQNKKIGNLASTMTECYKQLASKKNLIDQVVIDAVTLDFRYLNALGNEVEKNSLSAGEKQLMVISLLWALAICSRRKLPVIIDTPLSRLDSNHRTSLITTYFPKASEQTIILSTDSEIDLHLYELMKENVGDEFTLVYDDERKCTEIHGGYFTEVPNDY